MRRYIFTLLMMLALQSIMAQTTIICNAEGELPYLLQKEAGASELKICGPVNTEDIRAINNHTAISYLDLTEAVLSVIPEKAWTNLHSLEYLYLPKTIDTLYLDAISCGIEKIEVYLPGKYPHIKNYPVPVEKAPYYQWFVTENNEMLVVESESLYGIGGIYSTDKKILYKALVDEHDLSSGISGDYLFEVEKVWDYAFAEIFGADYLEIILHGIKEISNNAFYGLAFAYTVGNVDGRSGLCICLGTDTPPKKVGEGNLNHNVPCKDELIFWVSDIDLYIQDDPSWAELNLEDSNGIRWGTQIESILDNDKKDSPYYDLTGRPVANPTRGIYIKDGRKMIFNSEF